MKVKSDKVKSSLFRFPEILFGACLILLAGMMVSCDDDSKIKSSEPFNPALPVTVTGFTPERGGSQEEIIINGSNFGNDKNIVSVYIGGKKAVIVNVMSDKLFAFIPAGAYSDNDSYTGEVEVVVAPENGTEVRGVSARPFQYTPKKVVSTLCGYRNENDDQGEIWGSFDEVCGFNAEGCMAIDPLYPDLLYIAYDRSEGIIARLDLKNRVAERMMSATKFQTKRLRNIAFTNDGKYMLVSTDRDDNALHSTSVWLVTRNADGTFSDRSSCQPLVSYKQCNGVAVHPVNGEIYFNSYENGQLFRLDFK